MSEVSCEETRMKPQIFYGDGLILLGGAEHQVRYEIMAWIEKGKHIQEGTVDGLPMELANAIMAESHTVLTLKDGEKVNVFIVGTASDLMSGPVPISVEDDITSL